MRTRSYLSRLAPGSAEKQGGAGDSAPAVRDGVDTRRENTRVGGLVDQLGSETDDSVTP
jgi:hypothetical protein